MKVLFLISYLFVVLLVLAQGLPPAEPRARDLGIPFRVKPCLYNATQPGSKHIGDQLPLLSQKKLRTAWLDKAEVLQHLEKREIMPLPVAKR
ncbi:hypothetical protein GCM10023187_14920 [Nibrella viscosa]|uniref:Uncharacterized protein n=1 Tax=Nibrella viscosa TaxID=1084524 RepID=A0ABP8K5Y1_9BACT